MRILGRMRNHDHCIKDSKTPGFCREFFTRNTRESPLLYRRWDESGNCFETRS